MHQTELRVLSRGGILLAVASVIRLAAGSPGAETVPRTDSVLDSLLVESRAALETESRRSRALDPGERVDPNTADAVELSRLPGIGPALADRIVADRKQHGPFANLDDLSRVRGIGPALTRRLSGKVQLAAAGVITRKPREEAVRPRSGSRIDLNRANALELAKLKGIGPVLAARIIEFRQANGPFASPADLIQVPGIGPARLEMIESGVRRGGGGRP